MPRRPSLPRSVTRGRASAGYSLRAWLLKSSEEIEDSIGGGFDDWHSDLGDDDREDEGEADA